MPFRKNHCVFFFAEPSCGAVGIPGVVEQKPDANVSGEVYQPLLTKQPKQPKPSEERNASRTNEESEVTPSTGNAERSGKRKPTSGQLQGTVVSV